MYVYMMLAIHLHTVTHSYIHMIYLVTFVCSIAIYVDKGISRKQRIFVN